MAALSETTPSEATLGPGDTSDTTAAAAPSRRRPCCCCCRCHSNNISSVWYTIAVLAATSYLTYVAATRWLSLSQLPPSRQQWQLTASLALLAGTVVLLPFLLIAGCCRIGNLANDGAALGAHVASYWMDGTRADTWLRRAWVHGGPTTAFLHLMTSILLLLARLIIEAKFIDTGYLGRERVWSSSLQAFHGEPSLVFTLSSNHSIVVGQRISLSEDEQLRAQINQQFATLAAPSGEIANYAVALLVFGLQYAACFWSGNRWFGAIFSAHNITVAIVSVCAWDGFSVLYKVHTVADTVPSNVRQRFLAGAPVTVILYLLSAGLQLATTSVIYWYGYHKYRSFLVRQRRRCQIETLPSDRPALGYASHCAALLLLTACLGCQGPLLHDLALLTRRAAASSAALLTALAAQLLHAGLWVLLWLLLSIKRHWTFKLRVSLGAAYLRSAEQLQLLDEVETAGRQPADGGGETISAAEAGTRRQISCLVRQALTLRQHKQEEPVYWHQPAVGSPKTSPDSEMAGWATQSRSTPAADPRVKRSSIVRLPETETADSGPPGLSDTEDDDLATNANQNSSHLHHSKPRDYVRGQQYASLGSARGEVTSPPRHPPGSGGHERTHSGSDDTSSGVHSASGLYSTSGVHSTSTGVHSASGLYSTSGVHSTSSGVHSIPGLYSSSGIHSNSGVLSTSAILSMSGVPSTSSVFSSTGPPRRHTRTGSMEQMSGLEMSPLMTPVPSPAFSRASMSLQRVPPPTVPTSVLNRTLPPRLGGPPRPGSDGSAFYRADTVAIRRTSNAGCDTLEASLSSFGTHPAPEPSAAGVRISEPPIYRNTAGIVGSCG